MYYVIVGEIKLSYGLVPDWANSKLGWALTKAVSFTLLGPVRSPVRLMCFWRQLVPQRQQRSLVIKDIQTRERPDDPFNSRMSRIGGM